MEKLRRKLSDRDKKRVKKNTKKAPMARKYLNAKGEWKVCRAQ